VRGRDVFRGLGRTFAEEKLLHLLHDNFLILLARGVQTIFVEQHFAMLHPLSPSLLRDVVVYFLAQFAIEGRLGKSGQITFQFRAENFVFRHKVCAEIIAQAKWVAAAKPLPRNRSIGSREPIDHLLQ